MTLKSDQALAPMIWFVGGCLTPDAATGLRHRRPRRPETTKTQVVDRTGCGGICAAPTLSILIADQVASDAPGLPLPPCPSLLGGGAVNALATCSGREERLADVR